MLVIGTKDSFKTWFTCSEGLDSDILTFITLTKRASCCMRARKRYKSYNCTHPIPLVSNPDRDMCDFEPNGFIAMTSLQDFDLSWNKSLQTLTVPAISLNHALQRDQDLYHASILLKYALQTIRSPAFSRVHVIYHGHAVDFHL